MYLLHNYTFMFYTPDTRNENIFNVNNSGANAIMTYKLKIRFARMT